MTITLTGNNAIEQQIFNLEQSVTPRMLHEAATGSTNTFKAGTLYAGQTALQAMMTIRVQIDALRAQLT